MNMQGALMQEAAAAIAAFVSAQTQGDQLPEGLLCMLQGDD